MLCFTETTCTLMQYGINLRLTQSDSLRPITSALVSSYVVLNESADVGVNYECKL